MLQWFRHPFRVTMFLMGDNGLWTQLLTLGAVVLGGVITLATTRIANLQQAADRARERREDRLMPLYLSLNISVRDWVALLEAYALAEFPQNEFASREADMRRARESLHRITYEIDFMGSSRVAFETELLEDALLRLTEELGFHLRVKSVPSIPDTRDGNYVASELQSISERRVRLLESMQEDLKLRREPGQLGRMRRVAAQKSDPSKRDEHGFLIDDGRYDSSESWGPAERPRAD